MSTAIRTHVVAVTVTGLLSAAASLAAQPRLTVTPMLVQAPSPAPVPPVPPAAPAAPAAPRAPRAPRLRVPPLPPLPPVNDFNFDSNFDFNFDFDFDFPDLQSLNIDIDAIREAAGKIDVDAIRESARAAAESARVFSYNFAQGRGTPAAAPPAPPAPPTPPNFPFQIGRNNEDALYNQARQQIDQEHYDRAVQLLDRLMALPGSPRVDAALYWKSYVLAKQGQRDQALAALADMQRRFPDSRWLRDAKALEVEVRQASGQSVSPDAQNDEDIKLLALRGIMQSDPERALPMIEKVLAGSGSVKMRENALFVLSQSRTPKAREIISGIAKGGVNPDLQLRAIRYLGAIGGPESRQLLADVYRTSNDRAIKRAILQSMGASNSTDQLIEIARTEKDVELRRGAIRALGAAGGPKAAEALRAIYNSDASQDVRRDVLYSLFRQDSAATLVELARAEKDKELKKEIVQRLSNIKSKEATDYLLELLK